VIAKPDKFSVFIQRLPQLQQDVGSDLLTATQVQELIESRLDSNDQMIYGVPEMFVFIPERDREQVLRGIWNKIPKSQRALFIIMLIPQLDKNIDRAFGDFLTSAFKQSIRDVENTESLKFRAEDMAGEGDARVANAKLIRGIFESLLTRDKKDLGYRVGLVICDHQLGNQEEARAEGIRIWKEVAIADSTDFRVNQAVNRLLNILKDDVDSLMKALDEIEAKQGKSLALTNQRLNLIARKPDAARTSAALEKAAADHPENVGLQRRWMDDLRSRGLRTEAAGVLETLLRLQPANTRLKSQLESQWRSLRHPIRALAARQIGAKKGLEKSASKKSSDKKPRTPAATPVEIKKALDAGDTERARQVFRRLWRVFPNRSNNRVIYSPRIQIRSWTWPADPPKQEKPTKPVKRARGGYPAYLDKELPDQLKKPEAEPGQPTPVKRRNLHEVLVEQAFGEREMRRNLRSLDSNALQHTQTTALLKTLVGKEVERSGRDATIAGLLAKDKDGTAGKIEYGKLFALLEASAKSDASGLQTTLTSLMKNVNAKDTGQLRRMARLYARMGEVDKASVLWRWCAGLNGGGFGSNIDHGLLNEVIASLEGAARDRIVEAILAAGAPDDEDYWSQDHYYTSALTTWLRIGGAEVAYQRGQGFLKGIVDVS